MTTVQRGEAASQETTLRFLLVSEKWVGAQEIGQMLGISRQRVQQLIKREDFPRPEARLAMGSFWRRSDVVKWARATGRM